VDTHLRRVFAMLGVPNRVALAPWYITRSSDVLAAGRRHHRSQAISYFRDLEVRDMARYIGFHEVDDVDHWLHSPKRQELFGPMGITGQLFTDTAKSNRVGLILEIPDMEAFQKLLQSQNGADAMKFDGVRPETIVIFEEASGHV
jgi:hypothetical protein